MTPSAKSGDKLHRRIEKLKAAELAYAEFGMGVPSQVLAAVRLARLRCATPLWLSKDQRAEIKRTYERARELSATTGEKWHVDHIVPLQGLTVSGLHVPWNLRVVKAKRSLRKHANHDPDLHEHKLPKGASFARRRA